METLNRQYNTPSGPMYIHKTGYRGRFQGRLSVIVGRPYTESLRSLIMFKIENLMGSTVVHFIKPREGRLRTGLVSTKPFYLQN